MSWMTVSILTLMATTAVTIKPVRADESAHVMQSYILCKHDAECSRKFYMDMDKTMVLEEVDSRSYDYATFEALYYMYIRRQGDLFDNISTQVTFSDRESVSARQWLLFLRQASHCTGENEVFVLGSGCQCRNGHLCIEKPGYQVFFATRYLPVVNTALAAFLMYYIFHSVKKLRTNDQILHACESRVNPSNFH